MAFPKKLKNDAITTVAFEIRFHSEQPEELIVGRLADWATSTFPDATPQRTGAADMPLAIRKSNPQFANLSTLDFTTTAGPDSRRLIRTGNSVLGYILKGAYCGWDALEEELFVAIDALLTKVHLTKILRIGLRYTNAFRPDLHFIAGLQDINFKMVLDGDLVTDTASAHFAKKVSENHEVAYRIGTPNHWNEAMPPGTAVMADFDVYSLSELPANDISLLNTWVSQAHKFEKSAFASILPENVVEKLRDDS